MIRCRLTELVQALFYFAKSFLLVLERGLCRRRSLRIFIPQFDRSENFLLPRVASDGGYRLFCHALKGESCEGTRGSHLGVCRLRRFASFCWAGRRIGEDTSAATRGCRADRTETRYTKFTNEILMGKNDWLSRFLHSYLPHYFASCERSDRVYGGKPVT